VHTKNGLVPIDKIKVGDLVLSRPEGGGDLAYQPVNRVFRYSNKRVFYVDYFPGIFNFPQDCPNEAFLYTSHSFWDDHREFVVCTENHPVFVQSQGWTAVGDIEFRGKIRLELYDGRSAYLNAFDSILRCGSANRGFAMDPDYGPEGTLLDFSNGNVSIVAGVLYLDDEFYYNQEIYVQDVYDLEVANTHNYFVGKSGLWVLSERTD